MSAPRRAPRLTVLGAGSWGTTFAQVLADGGAEVTLWARREEVAREIGTQHRNSAYLGDRELPRSETEFAQVVGFRSGERIGCKSTFDLGDPGFCGSEARGMPGRADHSVGSLESGSGDDRAQQCANRGACVIGQGHCRLHLPLR